MFRVQPSPFIPVARAEKDLLANQPVIDTPQTTNRKQIYLLLGEPRTGKTTLGTFATISSIALYLDTDGYEKETWVETLKQDLNKFLKQDTKRICVVSVGKYRRENDAAISLAETFASDNVLVSICRFERIGEAK